jgi:drug/metabolite transporter (DMT)-like permease
MAKVATVASLRETSILFASLYGIFILKEKIGFLGFLSSCLIFAGVVLIKLYG